VGQGGGKIPAESPYREFRDAIKKQSFVVFVATLKKAGSRYRIRMPYKNKTQDREWHRDYMRRKRGNVTPVTPSVGASLRQIIAGIEKKESLVVNTI